MVRQVLVLFSILFAISPRALGGEGSGVYGWSVGLKGCASGETGRAPSAYMWLPDGCKEVKAVVLAQQNMTEEALFRMPMFRERLAEMGVGLVWVAPAFTDNWAPESGCQQVFERMMADLAAASGHGEIAGVPVVPLGHSAQATFPWNFAAWNPQRTLCIISFHGDAPRTNLCGYGRANVEWGRTRNIDGIPGLMVEGEFEWWEARVRPALAFRMMYPESCVSFLCDTGRGHFDCSPRTAEYIALFIRKAIERRLCGERVEEFYQRRLFMLALRAFACGHQNLTARHRYERAVCAEDEAALHGCDDGLFCDQLRRRSFAGAYELLVEQRDAR